MKTTLLFLLVSVVTAARAYPGTPLATFDVVQIESAARTALQRSHPEISREDISFIGAMATISTNGTVVVTARLALQGSEKDKTVEKHGYTAVLTVRNVYAVTMDNNGTALALTEESETASKSIRKTEGNGQQGGSPYSSPVAGSESGDH